MDKPPNELKEVLKRINELKKDIENNPINSSDEELERWKKLNEEYVKTLKEVKHEVKNILDKIGEHDLNNNDS